MKRSVSEGIVISPIKNGTVIDHITPGEGLTVIRILGIQDGTNVTFTVATNVTSSRGGRKDMVKIENRELVKSEVDKIVRGGQDCSDCSGCKDQYYPGFQGGCQEACGGSVRYCRCD